MSQKYEYRIRPFNEEYIVERRYVITEGMKHKGDWRDVKVWGWFFQSGPYVTSINEGRSLIRKDKRNQAKWDADHERRKALEKSRETIYID